MKMDVKKDEIEDKVCVFEDSLEIDFDYEIDVAKFFDFTQSETPEEIAQSELWFQLAPGHPPSPLVAKMEAGADDMADSVTSSPRYGSHNEHFTEDDSGESEDSSMDHEKGGPKMLKSNLKSTSQPNFQVNSRLLQPTASLMAKHNQHIGVRSTRVPRGLQRLGNPVKSPARTNATKRQKLESGYLRKVAQLKHQTSYSHKSSKKVGTNNVNASHAKPKATVPKEPDFATAHRALRHRSKNSPRRGNDAKDYSLSVRATQLNGRDTQSPIQAKNKSTPPLHQFQDEKARSGKADGGRGVIDLKRTNSNKSLSQERSDQAYSFRAYPLNKKVLSSKGDIGVFRNCKRETTIPREFKLSNSKKLSYNPPTELFNKLSLNPKNQPTLLLKEHPLQMKKVLKKYPSLPNMKENKNANAVTGKSLRCSGNSGRMITDIGNHLTASRSFAIY